MLLICPFLAVVPMVAAGYSAWTAWDFWFGSEDQPTAQDSQWPWWVFALFSFLLTWMVGVTVLIGGGLIPSVGKAIEGFTREAGKSLRKVI